MTTSPNTPLLEGVNQFEVDFVIPRVGVDLSIGIDPFLLFKSRDPGLRELHRLLLNAFNRGVALIRRGQSDLAKELFHFPEVAEIGFGYAKKGKQGSGIGSYLADLITTTLSDAPVILERGVRHIEEMQLFSLGIGPDRISDMSANLIKEYLINYTQKQCGIWGIPVSPGVPVPHIFDHENCSWYDGYFGLPLSPITETPIILVPRRIVRVLPWINYEEFFRYEFSGYLRQKIVKNRFLGKGSIPDRKGKQSKGRIVEISRREVDRVDHYVDLKESQASEAQPSIEYIDSEETCPESDALKGRLKGIPIGGEMAHVFQKQVLEIINFLFNPELIDGEMEVRTIEGTERRDIIFTNDSDKSFWTYLRNEHSGIFLMIETKNTDHIETDHINQTATYLGDRIGRIGFIATRNPVQASQERKIFSIYNDSQPRKIILVLNDTDFEAMLDMKCQQKDPMRYLQKMYRAFRTRVQ